MTVEERAQQFMTNWLGSSHLGTKLTTDLFQTWLEQLLRDQIEDCAIVANEAAKDSRHTHAMNAVARLIEKRIRALAASSEEKGT